MGSYGNAAVFANDGSDVADCDCESVRLTVSLWQAVRPLRLRVQPGHHKSHSDSHSHKNWVVTCQPARPSHSNSIAAHSQPERANLLRGRPVLQPALGSQRDQFFVGFARTVTPTRTLRLRVRVGRLAASTSVEVEVGQSRPP